MKNYTLLALLVIVCSLPACGQKGPLEVERPQAQQEEGFNGTR